MKVEYFSLSGKSGIIVDYGDNIIPSDFDRFTLNDNTHLYTL